MKVRCTNNTGAYFRDYEYKSLDEDVYGRFGITARGQYAIELGEEFLVMGIIVFQTYQAYLIDYAGHIFTCPCQLFEIIDNRINANWHFRLIDKGENIYPFIQAISGYYELCADKQSYENLIVEMDKAYYHTYFNAKKELQSQ